MAKGYIAGWKNAEEPHRKYMRDFWFTSKPEEAAYWMSRNEAEGDLHFFEMSRIVIPSAEGGVHVLQGFQVEALPPNKFVIWCEGPFISTNRSLSGSASPPINSPIAAGQKKP
jgi:hypothetical protein